MSDITELTESEKAFLEPYLPPEGRNTSKPSAGHGPDGTANSRKPSLPFVTLTYAQSLDSMISLAPGLRTNLSGPETKSMTHYLRLHHDAILVGVGTAIPDDPGLNCRYPGATFKTQPRPVVVDPQGRWSVDGSKVETLAKEGVGKGVWIICAREELVHSQSSIEK